MILWTVRAQSPENVSVRATSPTRIAIAPFVIGPQATCSFVSACYRTDIYGMQAKAMIYHPVKCSSSDSANVCWRKTDVFAPRQSLLSHAAGQRLGKDAVNCFVRLSAGMCVRPKQHVRFPASTGASLVALAGLF